MIYLYNTAKRGKEELVTQSSDHVTMYVCGPTVYDHIHVGNARLLTVFDTLFRVLQRLYPKVTYVRNLTDIDDKIIQAAADKHTTSDHIVAQTIEWFHEAVDRLGLQRPSVEPRATEHIPHMIAMIQSLIDKQLAYATNAHVMFDVPSFAPYGQLSGMSLEQLHVGARVEPADYKRNPLDFVLWKPSKDHEPGWDSPWGRGRPGWHIECSAMSTHWLGGKMDIHGGGRDLLFPHHENERAQTCACTGLSDCASIWMHVGMLTMDHHKMSKSLGNFVTLAGALNEYQPAVVRWALLSSHYRHALSWGADLLHQVNSHVRSLYAATELDAVQEAHRAPEAGPVDAGVWEALCDDLNTPLALHALHHLTMAVKNNPKNSELAHRWVATVELLGLWPRAQDHVAVDETWVQESIEKRRKARQEGDFGAADAIRQDLLDKGIVLEDSPRGTMWRCVGGWTKSPGDTKKPL
jgi:cysteinyl-tRNA synthetase